MLCPKEQRPLYRGDPLTYSMALSWALQNHAEEILPLTGSLMKQAMASNRVCEPTSQPAHQKKDQHQRQMQLSAWPKQPRELTGSCSVEPGTWLRSTVYRLEGSPAVMKGREEGNRMKRGWRRRVTLREK